MEYLSILFLLPWQQAFEGEFSKLIYVSLIGIIS